MPTYDYQCKVCGYTFEEFQSMSSEHLVICPSCGKPALKRLMAGGAGMIFKGSGFYQTDYKKSGSSTSSSSSASTPATPGAKPNSLPATTPDGSKEKTSHPAKPDTPKTDK